MLLKYLTVKHSALLLKHVDSSKRQSGGKGQFGDVWIEFTPNEEGKGFEFENAIVGGVVPREFIPAVEKGLVESMANGVLAGYPMVDVKAKLYDGSYHECRLI